MTTDNYRKHTAKNPLQKWLIDRFYAALLDELETLHPQTILDAGCGEGFTLARIRLYGIRAKLEGIDIRQEAIELGRKIHSELTLREGSVYELPYEDNAFDVVLCSEVLEHLEDPERALAEIRRVARRYCVITVPHEPFFMMANMLRGKNLTRWGNDIEHIQHWSSQGIARLAGQYMAVEKVRNPFPWTIVIGKKV